MADRVRRARDGLGDAERAAGAADERRLPAPSSPATVTTSPGSRRAASRAPSDAVSSGEPVDDHARWRSEEAELERLGGRLAARRDRRRRDRRGGGATGRPSSSGRRREVGLEHLEHPRRVQRGGRMEERVEQDARAAEGDLLLLPVHLRDPGRLARQELRREVAERRDDLRPDQLDLPEEVALAGLDLLGLRVAVARGRHLSTFAM